ncbi:hypothetical protein QEZ54_04890 [Catellatospora sp. KI3]|uniref:hypothetical protein n=1 Tax=Catellatospora sp. KI3 TaxID=3041620 RepID=UPI002482EFD8|nr:hypothetical protein [Catellatospora sp. KI3]MDI1460295.1 hypothetical protein [Catellatospora sp. KI3]
MTDPSSPPSDPTSPPPATPPANPWQPPGAPSAWQPPPTPAAGGWNPPGGSAATGGQPPAAPSPWAAPGAAAPGPYPGQPGPYQAQPGPYQGQPGLGPYATVPTFAPAPPSAPKKRNTGLIVGIVVGVVLLVACLCGVGVYAFSKLAEAANQANSATYDDDTYWDDEYWEEPTPGPSPSSSRAHVVEYRVNGKGTAKINFQTVAGYNTTVAAMPWTNRWTSYGLYLRTSVTATATGQQLTCVILIDGEEVARQSAKGSVTCIRDLEV